MAGIMLCVKDVNSPLHFQASKGQLLKLMNGAQTLPPHRECEALAVAKAFLNTSFNEKDAAHVTTVIGDVATTTLVAGPNRRLNIHKLQSYCFRVEAHETCLGDHEKDGKPPTAAFFWLFVDDNHIAIVDNKTNVIVLYKNTVLTPALHRELKTRRFDLEPMAVDRVHAFIPAGKRRKGVIVDDGAKRVKDDVTVITEAMEKLSIKDDVDAGADDIADVPTVVHDEPTINIDIDNTQH